jgi:hypothetical protein
MIFDSLAARMEQIIERGTAGRWGQGHNLAVYEISDDPCLIWAV